jgi:Fungal specific transcription factor domain
MHHFSISTCYTLASEPMLKNLWKVNVPILALQYPFVMHGILAVSALHLAHFQRSNQTKRDLYTLQASRQHQKGLLTANGMLANITQENCAALHIFTLLTTIYALGSPQQSGDLLIVGKSGVADWVTFIRGVSTIINSSIPTLKAGPLGPLLISGMRRWKIHHEMMLKDTPDQHQELRHLQQIIEETTPDPEHLRVYTQAVSELRKTYVVVRGNLEPTNKRHYSSDIFIWLFEVSEEYLMLLRERRQPSLAIFAYFCVVLTQIEENWWTIGWGCHIMEQIYDALDEEHRLWIRWPIEQIGWVPER